MWRGMQESSFEGISKVTGCIKIRNLPQADSMLGYYMKLGMTNPGDTDE